MEHLANHPKDHPNQHRNIHKLHNETGHLVLSLLESQWKLRTTWSEFPNGGKAIVKQVPALEEINKSKRAGL